MELSSIGIVVAQLGYLAWRLWDGLASLEATPATYLCVALMFSIGYFAADFISGVVHWGGDTLGSERTPLVGAMFVGPFRRHHVDPADITRHDFIETNGNSSIVAATVLLHVVALMPRTPGLAYYYGCLMASTTTWILATNQFHKWAHADRAHVPALVRWAQNLGLILSPTHHAVHHQRPHDTYYCITHGRLNPLLTRARFFRGLEVLVRWVAPRLLILDDHARSRYDRGGALTSSARALPGGAPAALTRFGADACPRSMSSRRSI